MNTKRNGSHFFVATGMPREAAPAPQPAKLMFQVFVSAECIAQCASIRDAATIALRRNETPPADGFRHSVQLVWRLEADTFILWTNHDHNVPLEVGALVTHGMVLLNSFLRIRFPTNGASVAATVATPATECPTFLLDEPGGPVAPLTRAGELLIFKDATGDEWLCATDMRKAFPSSSRTHEAPETVLISQSARWVHVFYALQEGPPPAGLEPAGLDTNKRPVFRCAEGLLWVEGARGWRRATLPPDDNIPF